LKSIFLAVTINSIMIDIQHDSPVPIHEQIAGQIMEHVAFGGIPPGAQLEEYRAFAQELLTNPQVVARAYADLEWDGVVKKNRAGIMEVTANAAGICRAKLQEKARQRIRQAIGQGRAWGLDDAAVRQAVEEALAAAPPLTPAETSTSIKKANAPSHRDSQGIQILSGKKGRGSS
jgi:DNA-binding transcriptional regulator YhcF (GntR family)